MAEINTDTFANKAVSTSPVSTSPITYRLDQFEGPLDLLLTLIQKNKFDIADIPISALCDQYMEYVESARTLDLDIASDFLLMASKLMLIKSRMLLPRERDGDEDPRSELAASVLEYAKAKCAATAFASMYAAYSGRFAKDTDEITPDNTKSPHEEKAILDKRYLRLSGATPLNILFRSCSSRRELIPTFLAILELLKSGRIVITKGYTNDTGMLSVDELTVELILRNKVSVTNANNT